MCENWCACFAAGIAMTFLVAPAAPIALRQIPGYANPNLTVPSIGEYLWQNWQAYIAGYAYTAEMLWNQENIWLWGALVTSVSGLALYVYAALKRSAEEKFSELSFALFWLVGGLALYYVAVLDRGAFNVRYSSFVTPALYALLGVAIIAWKRVHWSLAILAAVVLFAGFPAAIHADLSDEQFAREDISGVTQWLRDHAGANDVVFVDQKYPFGFYYDNYVISPDAEPQGREAAPARYLFVDINTVDERLNEWAAQAESVYWVQWYESDTDPRRAVAFLLDKEGQRAGEQWFNGYSIDWWDLEPPTHFELAPNMQPLHAQFGQAVRTVEASIPEQAFTPGDGVPVVIRWERVPDGIADRPLKARVALYDENDGRLAQVDKRILNDRHLQATEWGTQDQPLNVYMVDLPEDMQPGSYVLRLLVYDSDSLEPLPLIDNTGNPTGLELDLGQIQIGQIQIDEP